MAKQFFHLTGDYEGKYVRRLRQFGRVVFYRVVHDADEIVQKPYWLIQIKNFRPDTIDRVIYERWNAWGNGTFRFAHLKEAQNRFDELCTIPEYAAEEEERQKSIVRARNHAKAMLESGKIGSKNLPSK